MNQLYIVTKEFGTQNANDFHSNRELRYSIRIVAYIAFGYILKLGKHKAFSKLNV